MYAWRFKENFDGETNIVSGPSEASKEDFERLNKTEHPSKFRMLDDDGEVYGQGTIIDEESGFEPLDDYGKALGCTEIQYWENNDWRTL